LNGGIMPAEKLHSRSWADFKLGHYLIPSSLDFIRYDGKMAQNMRRGGKWPPLEAFVGGNSYNFGGIFGGMSNFLLFDNLMITNS
jgi:hypothetical protein